MTAALTAEPTSAQHIEGQCCTDHYDSVYALVSYIPEPLAEFLDGLRRELVPSCFLASHVTVLPPRPIQSTAQAALEQVEAQCRDVHPFCIKLGAIETFAASSVIYLGIQDGFDTLVNLHADMNTGHLGFGEPWPFHPHITLAQNFDPTLLNEKFELAERRWREWQGPREFGVQELCLVQRTNCQNWISLACLRLS